ncbi:MAG: methylmalonyl Co-A mutase-associated GTPase MeaB [Gammaproteobacteria bacterium]|nr:MAG: methylmalonyl Co-A mutase-associated GTPase MeaB [Gammaproteobacteria bacterium]
MPATRPASTQLTASELAARILARERGMLSRAITLTESTLAAHRDIAQEVLKRLLPHTGKAIRLGISGVPGVGKSTFIEALGQQLLDKGHRVAVLAVDPSSKRSGGSILGDKTRMTALAVSDDAYIRPSPTSGHLGGVNRVTRESILLCEAAGFDVVLVETVGVGQSETMVASMVDCYLLLMLPGAGDDLQGIKKGVLELADIIAVNKADGDQALAAKQAKQAYQRALSILQPAGAWRPVATTLSAATGDGIAELWETVRAHRRELVDSGEFVTRREKQRVEWFHALIEWQLHELIHGNPDLAAELARLEAAVREQRETPVVAATTLLRSVRQPV